MEMSLDNVVYAAGGAAKLNATIVYTWAVMGVIALVSLLATRRIVVGRRVPAWQNFLEAVVDMMRRQIREISEEKATAYLPFIGTLFLFILVSNLFDLLPGLRAPTSSLSTTAALAVCVFLAVPVFGVRRQGWGVYLAHYVKPSVLMLPFTLIGELSRTLSLAVRLFGNMLSGAMVAAILLSVAPLLFPVFTDILGLIISVIQAYIFSVLAMVYVASAARTV